MRTDHPERRTSGQLSARFLSNFGPSLICRRQGIFLFRTFGSLPSEGHASLSPSATFMAAILKIFKISKFYGAFVNFTSLGYSEVTSLFALIRR